MYHKLKHKPWFVALGLCLSALSIAFGQPRSCYSSIPILTYASYGLGICIILAAFDVSSLQWPRFLEKKIPVIIPLMIIFLAVVIFYFMFALGHAFACLAF